MSIFDIFKGQRQKATNNNADTCYTSDAQYFDTAFKRIPSNELLYWFTNNFIARKGVEVPAEDMTREWREWQPLDDAKTDIATNLNNIEHSLHTRRIFQEATISSRLFGGAGVLILNGDPDLSKPLNIKNNENIKLEIVPRGDIIFTPQQNDAKGLDAFLIDKEVSKPVINNMSSFDPWSNSVIYHQLRGAVHTSRIVFIKGKELPYYNSISSRFNLNYFLGESVLQSVMDVVQDLKKILDASAEMAAKSSFFVFTLAQQVMNEGLANLEQSEANLDKALKELSGSLGIGKAAFLKNPVDIKTASLNLAGMPDMIDKFLKIASGGFSIPQSRLYGQDLNGLNSSASEITRGYYDSIASEQQRIYHELYKLDALICAKAGVSQEDYKAEFVSLWQQDELEQSNIRNQDAAMIGDLYQKGLLTDAEARDNLLQNDVLKGLKDEQQLRDFEEEYKPKITQDFLNGQE